MQDRQRRVRGRRNQQALAGVTSRGDRDDGVPRSAAVAVGDHPIQIFPASISKFVLHLIVHINTLHYVMQF